MDTSSSMFESAKGKIRDALRKARPGEDVRVVVESIPYGVWVWDEAACEHVQMKNQEVLKALGPTPAVKAYINSLDAVQYTWEDVLGPPSASSSEA